MGDGWQQAHFEIQMAFPGERWEDWKPAHSETVTGETWGAFGIHEETGDLRHSGTYAVTHLPSGCFLVSTRTKKRARRFCEEIATLADWTAMTPGECPPDIYPAYLEAWRRAHNGMHIVSLVTAPATVAPGARP
jgi:hypothetical protein